MNASMISNYFKNARCLYTYDFTCQALTLVEVPPNSKYGLDDFNGIIHDYPRHVHDDLYKYAKGITKTKTKPKKKQKRTRKNK
jgi:hypothetical protein